MNVTDGTFIQLLGPEGCLACREVGIEGCLACTKGGTSPSTSDPTPTGVAGRSAERLAVLHRGLVILHKPHDPYPFPARPWTTFGDQFEGGLVELDV